ncbi:putative cytochrome P450 110 [Hyella patelloides LEGE 07179]|uniref:Putative cytochrome P450 110 n=1 Tax=Hyella patelloides LEGE 07179 TaxID=945734 RepID=A0A563W1E0_9CYAN|nr:cytochrome P450 [Hyella patelloides]VEP17476.1 putative cytochrome P450 110 [Hyella patelloides LEGE 07179]
MKPIPTLEAASGLRLIMRRIKAILRPVDFITDRARQYGDFYQLKLKNAPPTVMTSNPQAIENIFTASTDKFEVGRGNKMLTFLVGDNSLLLLDGKEHKNRRRLLMPPFHGESLQKCSDQIVAITNKVIADWQPNKAFTVRPVMQEITLRVMLSVVFGIDSGTRYDRLRELLTALLDIFNTPLSSSFMFFSFLQKDWGKFSPWGRFLLLKQEIRQLIYAEIAERRELLASGTSGLRDIFSLLLLAKDENGEGMTDEELHDELITLLFAGHETTASALAWLFYWIHYLPEVQDKLRFELDSVGENPDYKTINNLTYLDAIVSETLRIYPIVAGAFGRILTQPISVMGYDLEPKTWLMVSIYSLHHREDLYPDPEQFKPERFLQKTYSPYEYIPFGGGNRRCIGSALALLEMKLVTTTVLSRFQLDLTSNHPLFPVRRGLTLAPPSSFKMRIKNKLA